MVSDNHRRETAFTLLKRKRGNLFWRALSLLIAAVVVIYMLNLVEWQAFLSVVRRLSVGHLVGALLAYVLLNFFRALRYQALLNRVDISPLFIFPIGLFHNFLVRLLPFKLGEVAYIVMMRNRLSVNINEGVSSLFGSRLLELLVIVLVAAVSLLLSGEILPNQSGLVILLVAGCLFAAVLGLYYSAALIRQFKRIASSILPATLGEKTSPKIAALADEFETLHQPCVFAKALFWSLFTYSSSFAVNFILLQAVGLDGDWSAWIIIISIGMFATAFPFNISGFGAVELGWAFGLTQLAAYSVGEATSIGLMLNGSQLIFAAFSGIGGLVALRLFK